MKQYNISQLAALFTIVKIVVTTFFSFARWIQRKIRRKRTTISIAFSVSAGMHPTLVNVLTIVTVVKLPTKTLVVHAPLPATVVMLPTNFLVVQVPTPVTIVILPTSFLVVQVPTLVTIVILSTSFLVVQVPTLVTIVKLSLNL